MKRCWIFCLFIFAFSFAKAQNFDVSLVGSLMPGHVEGRGKYFEIKNSPYLNITLESSEEIEIILESIPKSINLRTEPSLKNSTILTLRGLEPKKVYYKYQDTYQNGTQIVSDEEGSVSWVQDLTEKHYIWIQEEKGTFIFPKDCPNWDATNSVCTLDNDIQETIEISGSDFTLDCNFKKIKGNSTHGIYIAGQNNVTIKNCDIQGFSFGIYSASSTGIRIESSSFSNLFYGIFLTNSSSSTIENNNFYDISYGIQVEDSSQNVIDKNNIFSSNNFGIYLYRSSFNFVNQNRFLESGFFVFDSYQNIVKENTVNEKPLIYLEGKENVEIKGAGQVIIVNSKNIKLEGESISNASVGVELWQVKDSEIANNQFTRNLYDVFLYSSNNNRIIKNIFSSNQIGRGIYFSSSTDNEIKENIFSGKGVGLSLEASSDNLIEKNVFSNNVWYGILFVNSPFPSANNVITKNTISGNYHGIRFESLQVRSNLIYLNNFFNNTSSIHYSFTPYFPNNWNSVDKIAYSYQGKIFNNYLGNYWQDYQGKDEDGDGIGDSPYFITHLEKDDYPLISSFENYSENSFATTSISINYFPKEPVKGTKVVFSAVSSIPFTKFEWQIASSTFSGTTTEFTFNENGEYQITLTATDNNGATSSTSTIIKVEPFSFAIITDLHIGRGYPDYDGPGFDDGYNGEEYYLTQRLRNVVNWIIQNKDNIQCDNATCSIKFLVVLGDVADSGEKSEFLKAKEILDELNNYGIPYVPVFGNHDVWPHTDENEATTTLGENYFDEIFWSENATNTKLMKEILNWERDEIHKNYKNFAFNYGGINFIGLDFNSREKFMKKGPGVGADAVLNFENKSWLEFKLKDSKNNSIIILSHHPIISDLSKAFSRGEVEEIRELIKQNEVLINFAGHIHGWYNMGIDIFEDANYEYPSIDITRVLTTEAIMVGSNEKNEYLKEHDKGIIKIVKVLEKNKIDYKTNEGKYKPETGEGKEFIALNPHISWAYKFLENSSNPCVFFKSHVFTHREISSYQWELGNGEIRPGDTIPFYCYPQPGTYNVTSTVTDALTGWKEWITRKIEIKEGLFSKIIKIKDEIKEKTEIISQKIGENLLEFGNYLIKGKDRILLKIKRSPSIPVAELLIDFDEATGDVDFSQMIFDSNFNKKKSILYMPTWPKVVKEKVLLIPK